MAARPRAIARPGRAFLRTIAVAAIATGAVHAPSPLFGQSTPTPPYRMVRPQGPGPHPALLFVSGCSGFAPETAPDHYPRVAQAFAAQGFAVVFVDYLGARGRKVCGGMKTCSTPPPLALMSARMHPRCSRPRTLMS